MEWILDQVKDWKVPVPEPGAVQLSPWVVVKQLYK